jgi:hypothetical protein
MQGKMIRVGNYSLKFRIGSTKVKHSGNHTQIALHCMLKLYAGFFKV